MRNRILIILLTIKVQLEIIIKYQVNFFTNFVNKKQILTAELAKIYLYLKMLIITLIILLMEGSNNFYSNSQNSGNYFAKYQQKNTGLHPNSQSFGVLPAASFRTSQPSTNLDLKEKNKFMFQSTMNFSTNTQSTPSLNSFARRAQQVPFNQESNTNPKFLGNKVPITNNQSSYVHTKDPRMASSAIFSLNNQTQNNFDRFPAFNLKATPGFQISKQKLGTPNVLPAKQSVNESVKEKRQRQMAAIKKQVEQLNKKMLNKPIPTISSTVQEIKSLKERDSPVSSFANQNSILPNYTIHSQKYKVTGPSSHQSYFKNELINSNQKGSQSQINQTQQKNTNEIDSASKYNYNYNKYNDLVGSNSESSNFNQYKNYPYNSANRLNNVKSSESLPTTYSSSSSSFSSSFLQSYPSTIQKDENTYLPKQNSTQNRFQQVNKLNENKGPSFLSKFNEVNPEQTGFKKKKFYEAEVQATKQEQNFMFSTPANQQTRNIQTPVYPEKKTMEINDKRQFKLKKITSVNYIDESIPLPEVKQFKFADFQIGKKMGKGQFGEVLLVRHKLTGWLCGLKVMDKKDIRDQDYVDQIARQLSIQFYLQHRNITQLYGYFQEGDKFYLMIEYCVGGQLLQKIRSEKRMKEKDVSKIIRQVCEGVDYIHKQQIIHRDLKPQNILFNFDTVKICDFGWAVYRGFGMRKTASGSPLYYPPEIVKGEQYDDKIDVWNIGMMTYQCLQGKIPFKVYSQMDLVRIVSDQITFPQYVDISENAKDFILKTMKKKGQQRLQIRQMLRHPLLSKSNQPQVSQSILIQFQKVLEG